MKAHSPISIRHKLQSLSLFLVLTTSILGMATTLLFSLRMEYQNLDRNLMNSAQVLAQSPDVADFLARRADSSVLTHYLNGTISRVQDIDAIVVADHNGVIQYCPDPAFVGTVYPDADTLTVLQGEMTEVDTGPGILPELLPFIFEPNVSTKGEGHGIGLSRIRELVNLYHGQIRVESEPKSGTAFFLSFQMPEEENGEQEQTPNA